MSLQIIRQNTSFRDIRMSSRDNIVSLTTENEILHALAPDLKRTIAPALKRVSLKKDAFLYQEEDMLDFIYFPETAVVSEFKMLEDGRMVEIAVTGREGAIGLSSVYGDTVVQNSTQVSQAGTALKIDVDKFQRMLAASEPLRMRLSQPIEQYIRQISQKAICNMYHSVKERLCTWLLMLQDRCGSGNLKLTHEQIARVLGVYRPSVTCIAQELREDRLIDYSRGGIFIRDRSKVERSACACYSEMGIVAAH